MVFIISRDFTAKAAGSRVKHVVCEKCHAEYCYEIVRQVIGVGSAPYFLMQRRAERQSLERAQANLERALQTGMEIVACPKCHWMNRPMAKVYMKQVSPRIFWPALGTSILGMVLTYFCPWVVLEIWGDRAMPLAVITFLLALGMMLFSPICFLIYKIKRRRKLDPNANYPNPTPLKCPLPATYLLQTDLESGEPMLVPAIQWAEMNEN